MKMIAVFMIAPFVLLQLLGLFYAQLWLIVQLNLAGAESGHFIGLAPS
jgi:hypothetical protein